MYAGMANFAVNPKHVSAGLAAIGIVALALAGYVKITTPEQVQCQVDLADRSARLELTSEAMESCGKALDLCYGTKP